MSSESMTVLVVGAGKTGAEVLRQLLKNPKLQIVTLDPRDEPYAVSQGILQNVDFKEVLTPLTLDSVINEAHPDLVLLTGTAEDMGLGDTAGVDVLRAAIDDELATIADVPVVTVSSSAT